MSTTHDLTYKGRVDPPAGTRLGPGLDGSVHAVVGSLYDAATDRTTVTVEQVEP